MTREELIEKMARAICLIDPRDDDPDAEVAGHMDDSGPRFPAWTFYRDQAEAALLSLDQSGFMIVEGWKPIETATKDGKQQILTIGPAMTSNSYVVWAEQNGIELWYQATWWSDRLESWVGWSANGEFMPTHWMTLPSPPKSTDDSKEAEANG